MIDIQNLTGLILAFVRMSGFIYFNPILGRRNFPAVFKTAFALVLTYVVYSYANIDIRPVSNIAEYSLLVILELTLGFTLGFIVNLFTGVIILGGELIDYQMGLSMSKIYDPQSNISLALSATFYNILFLFLFFSANGHVTMLRLMMASLELVPLGNFVLSPAIALAVTETFCQTIVLSVKLAMPIVALEFLLQIAVGIVMKIIPQINIFVLNIQFKLALGLIALIVFYTPTVIFLERVIVMTFDAIDAALILFAG